MLTLDTVLNAQKLYPEPPSLERTDALERFVSELKPLVCAVVSRLVEPPLFEDALQEALVACVVRLPRYRAELAVPSTYFYLVARYAALKFVSRLRGEPSVALVGDLGENVVEGLSALSAVEFEILYRRLVDGEGWLSLSRDYNLSVSVLRKLFSAALQKIL